MMWLWFAACGGSAGQVPVPTDVEAQAVADAAWGPAEGCECRARTVTVEVRRGAAFVVAVYADLQDDSMRSLRHAAEVRRDGSGAWVIAATDTDWQCWNGRGHPWFSTRPCS